MAAAISWLWPLLWPWDSLAICRDPPPPSLALVELLLVSIVWGRQWYFIVLKLIGRKRRRRRRREEDITKAEEEEVGNTADNVDGFLTSLHGCFEWLRNDTRSFTKAENVLQCIIIWLRCSDMDNYHHLKKPFNPLSFFFSFCITAISWIIKYYPLQDLEVICFVLLWIFLFVCLWFFWFFLINFYRLLLYICWEQLTGK